MGFTTTQASVWDTVGKLPLRNRNNSAAEPYQAGKVKWLIVRVENWHADYNEPQEMQNALIDKGVPESAIYGNYADFTTLDSIL